MTAAKPGIPSLLNHRGLPCDEVLATVLWENAANEAYAIAAEMPVQDAATLGVGVVVCFQNVGAFGHGHLGFHEAKVVPTTEAGQQAISNL